MTKLNKSIKIDTICRNLQNLKIDTKRHNCWISTKLAKSTKLPTDLSNRKNWQFRQNRRLHRWWIGTKSTKSAKSTRSTKSMGFRKSARLTKSSKSTEFGSQYVLNNRQLPECFESFQRFPIGFFFTHIRIDRCKIASCAAFGISKNSSIDLEVKPVVLAKSTFSTLEQN